MFAAILLLVVVVAYRVASGFFGHDDLHWMHNFAPVTAVALCGAAYLPRRWAMALPMVMLLVSDLVLNICIYHEPIFTFDILPRYAALALISWLGLRLRGNSTVFRLLGASVASSVVFYVITNTGSWLHEDYAKNVFGWIQALTVGLPGFPPTWMFYRATLLSDLFFTLLFAACMSLPARQETAHPAAQPVES